MPSGHVHRTATLLVLPLAGLTAGAIAGTLGKSTGLQDAAIAASLASTGVLATLAINPDLDLVETYIHHKVRKNPFLFFFYFFWLPYGKLIPHRHWIAHAPVCGTLFRLLYMLAGASLVFACAASQFPSATAIFDIPIPSQYMWWIVFGMMISDTLHYVMDVSVSRVKRII